jgi:malonate-semialdehyde dehydrogenase (acetylating) / methylmalonate-semialdehyde dehydrogenase
MTLIEHWIGGKAHPNGTERTGPVFDPARGVKQHEVVFAGDAEIEAAVAAAKAAFPAWRDTSIARRSQVMFAFRELLNARKDELAAILTSEHGKVLTDAAGEIARGLEVVEFATGFPHLLKGEYT